MRPRQTCRGLETSSRVLLDRGYTVDGLNTRRSQIGLLIVTAFAVGVGAAAYYPSSRAAQQQRNLALAQAHANRLAPALAADARFAGVRAVESARGGGTLLVVGTVWIEEDLAALRTCVESSACPVEITWSVEVRTAEPATLPSSSM